MHLILLLHDLRNNRPPIFFYSFPATWYEIVKNTNIFVPGYLGTMVTGQQQFCCIFAARKDKFDSSLKKLFHSSTSNTYHHNSSLFLSWHKNIRGQK